MSETFKIVRENNIVDELSALFLESKDNIKDVFCAIRFRDGKLYIVEEDVPFETLCVISKKLDLLIDYRQQEEEFEFEDDDDLIDEDLE